MAREHGATLALLFTAQISMLMSLPEDPADRENDLRLSISHVVSPAFTERYGTEILTTFSQTESLGLGVMTPPGSREFGAGVVGPAMPPELEIRVVDPDDREVPRGERGEICLRHPHLMLGYHRDPDTTGVTMRGGWLHTGDIGTMDDRGWLTFHGRLKNVIKRMGENIAGEEIEFALMRHPDVEEAVVCGVPDPIRSEEVYAVVHCREGRTPEIPALIAWIGRELSAWKLPRYVRVEPTPFPRLPNGKLDRVQITRDVNAVGAWDREAHRVQPNRPA
jgi:crotonobetaine/carnitine-CoA ligase